MTTTSDDASARAHAAVADYPEVMVLEEVAAVLRFGRASIRMMAAAGTIPAVKVGQSWRFLRADIADLLLRPAHDCVREGATIPVPQ